MVIFSVCWLNRFASRTLSCYHDCRHFPLLTMHTSAKVIIVIVCCIFLLWNQLIIIIVVVIIIIIITTSITTTGSRIECISRCITAATGWECGTRRTRSSPTCLYQKVRYSWQEHYLVVTFPFQSHLKYFLTYNNRLPNGINDPYIDYYSPSKFHFSFRFHDYCV